MGTHLTGVDNTPDLAFISQHLFTAILWVDETLHIKWLNTQAEQLLAISQGRLLNQSILLLLAPEELIQNSDANLDTVLVNTTDNSKADTHKTCTLTERFAHAHHYQQPFIDHDHSVSSQLFGSNGSTVVLVDYSVTPLIHDEQTYFIIEMWSKDRQSRISKEQRQQQQYSVARHMLRSVAHEVKNPLAGIRGAAQLLQRQFTKLNDMTLQEALKADSNNRVVAKKLRTYTDIIISETDRLTHLISQLLGSNQLPNWQTLNIHEPLEHVLTLVLNQYPQVLLQRDYDLSLPELNADKNQLIQVFLNLLNNACESMIEYQQQLLNQSTLSQSESLQTDNSYQPQLSIQTRIAFQHTIGTQQHKQVLQVIITDNGSGIDAALIGQIFFPMVTSRATGTGLGLSIVQDIVSRHHGMIDVSSVHDETRFTLYLPFTQPVSTAQTSL